MKNYQKLKCVQGLIMGLDEQLYQMKQLNKLDDNKEEVLINSYYNAVLESLGGLDEKT